MMKKLLAGFIVGFFALMSFVLVKGYLKSSQIPTNSGAAPETTQQTTAVSSTNKSFDASEVTKHSSQNDCWLIINKKVYDVTDFISKHPGGSSDITKYCGTDATKAFETQDGRGDGHSSQANSMLADYLLGNLQ